MLNRFEAGETIDLDVLHDDTVVDLAQKEVAPAEEAVISLLSD